ncbi:hypothetical protein [Halorussus amylolyticus]|uniref:hypothetical protein n=1 Tax=Halorussus amylolyticus TaxID=1126242 RepID=UPI00104C24B8|nr:hypothetical protein [Halorussus amylolyticus]
MARQTQADAGRSLVERVTLLALTFAVGYVLGSRTGRDADAWEDADREPTRITIDDAEESTEETEE